MSRHAMTRGQVALAIEKLSDRMECQTFLPGADRVYCTMLQGRFHRGAGELEEMLYRRTIRDRRHFAQCLKVLRWIQLQHLNACSV